MRLDREGIKQAFHQVASQGKPDAELLGSLAGSKGVDSGSPAPPLPATPLRLLRADWGVPPAVLEVPTELRGEPSAARLSPGQG